MESPRVLLTFKQQIAPLLRHRAWMLDIGAFLLALLLGRVEMLGALLPFGIAFAVALDIAGSNGFFPLAGALLGALLAGTLGHASLGAVVAYTLLRLAYPALRKRCNAVDKLLLLAISQLLLLPLFYRKSWQELFMGLCGLAVVLLLTVSFQNGIRAIKGLYKKQTLYEEEQLAICLLMGALALGFCDIGIHGFSLGMVLVAFMVMFAAYSKGLFAVAAAAILGGMLLLAGKGQPLLVADLALCALGAAVCKRTGNWGVAAAFCICAAMTEAYFGELGQRIGAINAIPAGVVLAAIPRKGLLFLRAMVDTGAHEERTARKVLERMQVRLAEDMEKTASTVEQVADLFPTQAKWAHDAVREREVAMRAVLHVCADCSFRGACWREREETMNAVDEMLTVYAKGMRPRPVAPIKSDCKHGTSIAAAAAQARDAYREQCTKTYYASMQHAFANRQLQGIGSVIRGLGEQVQQSCWPDEGAARMARRTLEREGISVRGLVVQRAGRDIRIELRVPLRMAVPPALEELVSKGMQRPMRLVRSDTRAKERVLEFEAAGQMRARYGTATLQKRGSSVSGDSTQQENLPNGCALYVLSDGMGSGRAAKEQSSAAVDMLCKLYRIGYERDIALECINRLLMQQGEHEVYATLDALHVQTQTGQAEFIKCGGCPSFVLRDGQVHTIYAEALPAGIVDEALPAVQCVTLKRNDAVVLLSDGALDALGEDTMEEIKRCVGGANTCEDAARALLRAAKERDWADDMTVLVVRLQ